MLALITARAARALDEDLPPLCAALTRAGLPHEVVNWDDAEVDWTRYRAALLRSTWDYIDRFDEFGRWLTNVSAATRLINPTDVVRWNVHKGYLLELAAHGVPIVPTTLVRPGQQPQVPATGEFVVKPAIGAGSRDARRFADAPEAAGRHACAMLAAGRDVLIQPYQARVDDEGETALLYFSGVWSHAIRKGPLLTMNADATEKLFAPEAITPRSPSADQLALAERILAALPFPTPLYARVDLLRDAQGSPVLLELELTEPSLFFDTAEGSADRFVTALTRWLE